jgi:FkbM family methyltransferase
MSFTLLQKVSCLAYAPSSTLPQRALGKLALYIRKITLRFANPEVFLPLASTGIQLAMPLSHDLPFSMAHNSAHDQVLPRFCRFIIQNGYQMNFVDVGANIGDTSSLIVDSVKVGNYLCVEGDSKYFGHLSRNISNLKKAYPASRFEVATTFLSDSDTPQSVHVRRQQGTTSLMLVKNKHNEVGTSFKDDVQFGTLDIIINDRFRDMGKIAVLKTDVDGFDYRVIRGAKELIARDKPFIFFECHPVYLEWAKENPNSIQDVLADLGYTHMIIYLDSRPLVALPLPSSTFSDLLQFAKKSGGFYDVLAFHKEHSAEYEAFRSQEFSS